MRHALLIPFLLCFLFGVACKNDTTADKPDAVEPAAAPAADPAPAAAPEPAAAPADAPAVSVPGPFADRAALRIALPETLVGASEFLGAADAEPKPPEKITLTSAADIAGVPCAAGGPLILDRATWRCRLARSYALGGWTTQAEKFIVMHYGEGAGRVVMRLSELEPAVPAIELGGLSCKDTVHFHADGSLRRCILAKPHTFGETTLKPGTEVFVTPSGRVAQAELSETHRIDDQDFEPGILRFDPQGLVKDYKPRQPAPQ